jgi:hypothetical protein
MNPLRQEEDVGARRGGEETNPLTLVKHNHSGNVAQGGRLLARRDISVKIVAD